MRALLLFTLVDPFGCLWKLLSKIIRGGSRGTSNNCIGELNSSYLLRKTKFNAIFALLHRCSMYLNLPLIIIINYHNTLRELFVDTIKVWFFNFYFSNNRIGVDGALALAKGLDANNTLEILQVIISY